MGRLSKLEDKCSMCFSMFCALDRFLNKTNDKVSDIENRLRKTEEFVDRVAYPLSLSSTRTDDGILRLESRALDELRGMIKHLGKQLGYKYYDESTLRKGFFKSNKIKR